jgi:hypothetical protein
MTLDAATQVVINHMLEEGVLSGSSK